MTNKEIWQIALRQSAIDCNCEPEDFLKAESMVTISRAHLQARKYLPLPFACDLTSYGNNIVAQCREDLVPVVEQYPDTKVYVAGNKCGFRQMKGIKKWLMDHAPDYDWYIQSLIERYGLRDNLVFLGYLSEEQMRSQLLQSQVFVSASSIENHSTLLGEAMITGVPSIASCVGGLQDMVDHGEDGFLYPFEETYTLAAYILRLFEDRALAEQFSRLGHIHAARTYDRDQNRLDLLAMYDKIGGADK